jgi:hypothetical protein
VSNLSRPKARLYICACLFLLYALYGAYFLFYSAGIPHLVGVALAFATAIGLFIGWPWARYAAFIVSGLAVLSWLLTIANETQINGWPYSDVLSSIISLLPGLVWVSIWAAISWAVQKSYRELQPQPEPSV